MQGKQKTPRKKASKSQPVKPVGKLTRIWEFMKGNAKGIVDTLAFTALAGAIYVFGEKAGDFLMQQLPTEESAKAYYNQLMAEARGAAMSQ